MIIRNYTTGGLKAQKHIAQGIALGKTEGYLTPCKGKSSNLM